MVAQHVADVLAQEALDALAELLHPVHVRLRHPPGAVRRVGRPGREPLDAPLHFIIFDPFRPNIAYINVQHPDSDVDRTIMFMVPCQKTKGDNGNHYGQDK
jgi:hypothetical protein